MSIIGRQSRAICALFSLLLSACSFEQFVDAIDENARVTCDVLEHRDGVLEAIQVTAATNSFTFNDGPVPEDQTQIIVSMDRGPAAVEIGNSDLDSIWINSSVISLSETDIYDGKDIDLVVEELVAAIEEACET